MKPTREAITLLPTPSRRKGRGPFSECYASRDRAADLKNKPDRNPISAGEVVGRANFFTIKYQGVRQRGLN